MTHRPAVMGILNVTPDSFYDGGRYVDPGAAAARAWEMVEAGADLIDVGAESTRPGAARVPPDEQLRRLLPVLVRLRDLPVPRSVDTTRAPVARAALDAGVTVINDVSAGVDDPGLLAAVAGAGATVVLMHMRGAPQTMGALTDYDDVVTDVRDHLAARCAAAEDAGIPAARQWVDPGIGFAKSAPDSLRLLARLGPLLALGRTVLVGASRKSFLGALGHHGDDRLEGSLVVAAAAVQQGDVVVRAHDVGPTRRAVDVAFALREAGWT